MELNIKIMNMLILPTRWIGYFDTS